MSWNWSIASAALALVVSIHASAAPVGTGTLSGVFQNPIGPFGFVVDGVGTNRVETGTPAFFGEPPTSLQFDSFDFSSQEQGETFVGGRIHYFNGSLIVGSPFDTIDLAIDTVSLDPLFTQQFIETLTFANTVNLPTNTDEQNADTLFFQGRPDLGGFRVFEGQSGIVDVLLEFDALELNSLELIGFGNVLTPGVAFVTADPFTPVDPNFAVAVPIPGTWQFVLFGLVGLALIAHRRSISRAA